MIILILLSIAAIILCALVFQLFAAVLSFFQKFFHQSGELTKSIMIIVGGALVLFIWLRPGQATAIAQNIVYKVTHWFAPSSPYEDEDEFLSL